MRPPRNSKAPTLQPIIDVLPPSTRTNPRRHRFGQQKRAFIVVCTSLVLVAILAVIWVVWHHHKPTISGNLEDVHTIERLVSRHYVLPASEDPALATVTDKTKLQTPFLAQTENGDKLLIYQKAKRVVIYRPSIDKIIDIGPVSLSPTN